MEWISEREISPARRTVLSERFLAGFESRTRSLTFRFTRQREDLIRFSPPIPAKYAFSERGRFVIKSLLWQAEHLDSFRDLFIRFVNGR